MIDWIFISGRTWKGSAFGGKIEIFFRFSALRQRFIYFYLGWKSVESVPKLVDDYLNKILMVDEFVTHQFKLEDINEAFHVMHEGKR